MNFILLTIIATLCSAYMVGTVLIFYYSRKIPVLANVNANVPSQWPSLSIIIPACNEEETIDGAMSTFMELDYPNFEIIAVNDRSTDQTGARLEKLAEKIDPLRVIHIKELPTGWLGKVHAMHVASKEAKGDFLIYADADVHFAPQALRKIIAMVVEKNLDHCTIMPGSIGTTFSLECLINAFMGFFCLVTGAGQVNEGKAGRYVGAGAFNLVRRSLFEQTEGWEWLRLEIADDVGLAFMMHRHQAKSFVVFGKNLLSLQWYKDIPGMVRGMEKNTFAAACRFSIFRAISACVLILAIWVAPLISFWTPFWGLGIVALLTGIINPLTGHSAGDSRLAAVLAWVYTPIFPLIVLRSMYITLSNNGIAWRGTFYPLKELKENQRVKL
jgi:glycosyltransferase involved in cell wall biosynthesis